MGIFRSSNSNDSGTQINGGQFGGVNYGITGGVHHGDQNVGESAEQRRTRLDAEADRRAAAVFAAIDEANAKKNK